MTPPQEHLRVQEGRLKNSTIAIRSTEPENLADSEDHRGVLERMRGQLGRIGG